MGARHGGTRRYATPVRSALALAFGILCLSLSPASSLAEPARLWNALRAGGHLALMRHAIAPGTGDPPSFKLGDCGTQRNLSKEGRDQAARIGARFRANGIATARVVSSQWCRCIETARSLRLGEITELPFLNSLHGRSQRVEPQSRAFKRWLAMQTLDRPVVVVTHNSNIRAWTGRFTASGEVVVVRRSADGGIAVVGTIRTE